MFKIKIEIYRAKKMYTPTPYLRHFAWKKNWCGVGVGVGRVGWLAGGGWRTESFYFMLLFRYWNHSKSFFVIAYPFPSKPRQFENSTSFIKSVSRVVHSMSLNKRKETIQKCSRKYSLRHMKRFVKAVLKWIFIAIISPFSTKTVP